MESTTFFPGVARKVVLGPPAMLLGANKSRRIKIAVSMPLNGEAILGMPDWLGDAFTAVSRNFTEVEPQLQELLDIALAFSDTQPKTDLFDNPSAKAPGSELRGFKVHRVGDAENPDVELKFAMYSNFSREFWKWSGEKAGNEVFMHFPSTKVGMKVVSPQLPLEAGESSGPVETAAEDRSIPSDPTLEDVFGKEAVAEVKAKNGPGSLKAFHEKASAKTGKSDKGGVSSKRTPGARNSLTVN
jgi:hypothetical protein